MLARKIVLPDPENLPTAKSKRTPDKAVALLVSSKLRLPECFIARRLRCMFWAAVPEAAVHKHRQAMLWEQEVGIPKHASVAPPACDAVTAEQRYHRELSGLVAPPSHTGHDV